MWHCQYLCNALVLENLNRFVLLINLLDINNFCPHIGTDLTDTVEQFAHRLASLGLGAFHRLELHKNGVNLCDDVSDRVLHAVDATLQQHELLAGCTYSAFTFTALAKVVRTSTPALRTSAFYLVIFLADRQLPINITTRTIFVGIRVRGLTPHKMANP